MLGRLLLLLLMLMLEGEEVLTTAYRYGRCWDGTISPVATLQSIAVTATATSCTTEIGGKEVGCRLLVVRLLLLFLGAIILAILVVMLLAAQDSMRIIVGRVLLQRPLLGRLSSIGWLWYS